MSCPYNREIPPSGTKNSRNSTTDVLPPAVLDSEFTDGDGGTGDPLET